VAVDLDSPDWSHWVDAPDDPYTPTQGKDWVWREDRVRALLSERTTGVLFVSGCAENMGRLRPLFDLVVLLSAPIETVMSRLKQRSSHRYGHSAEDQRKVAHLIETVEPLLRQMADHEIRTTRTVQNTADQVLNLSRSSTARV
jgi:shikimate kinase